MTGPAGEGAEVVASGGSVGEAALLRDRLADLAAEQATLEAELAAFHADWLRQVGTVMARLDECQARILAVVAERSHAPGDVRAAQAAEDRARQTTAEARAVPPPAGPVPTADLKRLFRDAAKRMHPDLAGDDAEARAHAEAFMKRLNAAYRAGDAGAIRDLAGQWDASPFAPAGPDPAGRRLGGLRAAVARAERRIAELRASQLADLMERALAATVAGDDLLDRMRSDAEAALASAQTRLSELGERAY